MQQKSKGFIVFATANTLDSGKKLLWKGVAYSLGKKENEGWKLSKKKSVDTNGKEMDHSAVAYKFPQAHTSLTKESFWGFMNSQGDMEKTCESSKCKSENDKSSISFEGYGTGQGSAVTKDKKLGEGTSKLSGGWDEVFTKTELDMGGLVQNMTGQWERKVWSVIDEKTNS